MCVYANWWTWIDCTHITSAQNSFYLDHKAWQLCSGPCLTLSTGFVCLCVWCRVDLNTFRPDKPEYIRPAKGRTRLQTSSTTEHGGLIITLSGSWAGWLAIRQCEYVCLCVSMAVKRIDMSLWRTSSALRPEIKSSRGAADFQNAAAAVSIAAVKGKIFLYSSVRWPKRPTDTDLCEQKGLKGN